MPRSDTPGGRRWSADDPFKLYHRTNNRTGLGKGQPLPDDDLGELKEDIDDMINDSFWSDHFKDSLSVKDIAALLCVIHYSYRGFPYKAIAQKVKDLRQDDSIRAFEDPESNKYWYKHLARNDHLALQTPGSRTVERSRTITAGDSRITNTTVNTEEDLRAQSHSSPFTRGPFDTLRWHGSRSNARRLPSYAQDSDDEAEDDGDDDDPFFISPNIGRSRVGRSGAAPSSGVRGRDNNMRALERELERRDERIQDLRGRLRTLNGEIARVRADSDTMHRQRDELQQQNDQLMHSYAQLQFDKRRLQAEKIVGSMATIGWLRKK